jgi:hypothetical protein
MVEARGGIEMSKRDNCHDGLRPIIELRFLIPNAQYFNRELQPTINLTNHVDSFPVMPRPIEVSFLQPVSLRQYRQHAFATTSSIPFQCLGSERLIFSPAIRLLGEVREDYGAVDAGQDDVFQRADA